MSAPARPLLLAVGAALAAGCIAPRGYHCASDDQCRLADAIGRCEPEGYCSYPDDACASGYRFESQAPGELAGACVDDACDERPCSAVDLVVGSLHTCVRDGEGLLWCWGGNVSGQLGRDASTAADACPAPVSGLTVVTRASAAEHMCAQTDDGRLWCWGRNDEGQTDWHSGAGSIVRAPIEIDDLGETPQLVDVGPTLSCVSREARVACWGRLPPSQTPPLVFDAPATLGSLATGDAHACGVGDGAVVCLGDDSKGQLGDGDPGAMSALVPSQPIAIGAIAVDAGDQHSCAIVADATGQTVQCWGANDHAQCGAPLDAPIVATAVTVPDLLPGPYRQLALGARHSCVLAEDGRVQCWGDNAAGQVGPEAPQGFAAHTVEIDGEAIVAEQIGAGESHTCARTQDAVICWGDNGSLQLGAPSSALTRASNRVAIGCDRG